MVARSDNRPAPPTGPRRWRRPPGRATPRQSGKLLDEGVDVNTKFRYGATALSYAADRGHLDVAKLLVDRGADVNARDTFYNATPLTWAVSPAMGRKPQHPDIVRLLLEHGAQPKGQALMAAVAAPDLATVKVVLDSGGLQPAQLSDALEAAKNGKRDEIAALLEKPARSRASNSRWTTRSSRVTPAPIAVPATPKWSSASQTADSLVRCKDSDSPSPPGTRRRLAPLERLAPC